MDSKVLILPAAGSGSRMSLEVPKPYLEIAGRTILEHTLRRFLQLEGLVRVVVAASPERMKQARAILDHALPGSLAATVVEGGDERQHSIRNALVEAGDAELVLVHDAVRPFVTPAQIDACCRTAADCGGAVLGVPARDTIKRTGKGRRIVETPSRRELWQAQTPQVFRRELLVRAYEQAREEHFTGTDDASLVERAGGEVRMVEGSRENFKITYPLDLKLARLLLEEH
ncbi:MAG: 2-C-methyl-D-erythritol 4-phosphate cytidylyltransferase [Balneolaceae bacterium]|nr:2-C-methyl-D-erythritol 4-phosphate cytidylyltransferase [Balneolaceae bacterium]